MAVLLEEAPSDKEDVGVEEKEPVTLKVGLTLSVPLKLPERVRVRELLEDGVRVMELLGESV